MSSPLFSILPIGGVGEIGSNFTLVKTPAEWVLIDCGILFPYEDFFDINYLIPNFEYVESPLLKKIIITHGHEDHIGALPHLIMKFPQLEVWCSGFTEELIKNKFKHLSLNPKFKSLNAKQVIPVGNLNFFPFHVNHSIPQTHGLILQTNDLLWGNLFISDFKVDQTATHEAPFDFEFMNNKLRETQNTAFFIDSTNILNSSKTTSETELYPNIEEIINQKNERIFITLFSSNVHRLNKIIEQGILAKRKIGILGRSIYTYLEAAYKAGISIYNPEDFSSIEELKKSKSPQLIILSGCQGDFLSALRRFSFGEDTHLKPKTGDIVVFSSKVIPGNEKKVSRIYNKLTEFGVEIIHAKDKLIHSSGHPGQEDLKILINNFTPMHYFPIHGETYFLKKHVEFIEKSYPKINPHLVSNFQEISFFDNADIKIKTLDPKEPLIIHGNYLPIERNKISERRKLATRGSVFISLNSKKNQFKVTTLGLPDFIINSQDQLIDLLTLIWGQEKSRENSDYVQEQLRIKTSQFFNSLLGYKPIVTIHCL